MAKTKQMSSREAADTVKAALVDKLPDNGRTGVMVIAADTRFDVHSFVLGHLDATQIAGGIVRAAMAHQSWREVLEILLHVQVLPPELAPTPPHSNVKIFAYVESLVQGGYSIDDLLGALMAVAAKYAKQPAEGKCAGGVQQCRACFIDTADEAYSGEVREEPHSVN